MPLWPRWRTGQTPWARPAPDAWRLACLPTVRCWTNRAPRWRSLRSTAARPVAGPHGLRDDLAFTRRRTGGWPGPLRPASARGVRLPIPLRRASVLTGLGRRLSEQGPLVAFDGARLDTSH